MPESIVTFGPFRFSTEALKLEKSGQSVVVGRRALEILRVLISHAGEVVGKRELAHSVWPDAEVEDGALRVHINSLRKVLAPGGSTDASYVQNVPGRGYAFVEPVVWMTKGKGAAGMSEPGLHHGLLPANERVWGRDDTVACILRDLSTRRLVSILGPGGVGKTTVALAVAHARIAAGRGEVRFVELGHTLNPMDARERHTEAAALGWRGDRGQEGLLLVIDGCEHLTETVADWIAGKLRGSETLSVLTTSRQSLRLGDEQCHRLAGLDRPPRGASLSTVEALNYAAIRYFLDRAVASVSDFEFGDEAVQPVVAICDKAAGLPLALEIAAARLGAFGLGQVERLLDDPAALTWPGRRTAPPRQQSLYANLRWSYDRLTPEEQAELRRLAMSPETSSSAVGRTDLASEDILTRLAEKSLLELDDAGGYRLVAFARTYLRGLDPRTARPY